MARLFPSVDATRLSPNASASSSPPRSQKKSSVGNLPGVEQLLPHETHTKASQALEVLCWGVHDALMRQLTVSFHIADHGRCTNHVYLAVY